MTNKKELNTQLVNAAYSDNLDEVKELLEKGADINTKDEYGNTALMEASCWGYEEIVKLLLKKGADVDTKDKDGWTALMWASRWGYEEIVKILVEKENSLSETRPRKLSTFSNEELLEEIAKRLK